MSSIATARTVLHDIFGFTSFRGGQEEVIAAVLAGRDTVAVMPTGQGKSLCYQIPALVLPHCTLVISPLLALMKDQTERLRQRGITAEALHSGLSQGEVNDIIHRAYRGDVKLLYVAPERLEGTTFRRLLRSIPLSLVAVDEAHCISEWGHDFRPAYMTIPAVFEERARVPVVALTATATPDVREDIVVRLSMTSPVEIVRGFDRPNLAFRVERTAYKAEFITRLARTDGQLPMLVYAGSRKRVDLLAHELKRRGLNVDAYHAGRETGERSAVQDRFLSGTTQILVATNAFGMGIDKADIRNVVHTDLTLTLEAYYQEAGRAGRDGVPATCTMLVQREDRRLMEFFLDATYPEYDRIVAVYGYLCERAGVRIGEVASHPVLAEAGSISSDLHMPVAVVNGILGILERHGLMLHTTASGAGRLMLRTTRERLAEEMRSAPPEKRTVMEGLIRLIGGRSIDEAFDFSVTEFLRRTGVTAHEFGTTMRSLQMRKLVVYTAPMTGGGITLLGERMAATALPIDMETIHRRRNHAYRKLDVVARYAETPMCKRNFILAYFRDGEAQGTCGRCSSCLPSHAAPSMNERLQAISMQLISAAYQVQGRFGRQVLADIVTGALTEKVVSYRLDRCAAWATCREHSRQEVLEALDGAIERRWLQQTADMYPTIGVLPDGRRAAGTLPSPIHIEWQQSKEAPVELVRRLRELRTRIAGREGVPDRSLAGLRELERIAIDQPMEIARLVGGRHGSEVFISRYGAEIVRTIHEFQAVETRAVPKIRPDDTLVRIAEAVEKSRSFEDAARSMRMTLPTAAAQIQRAIEAGLDVDRRSLVPDDLYDDVLDYMRHHRYAKLRHVRERVGADVDLPLLRLALSFARRDLYNDVERG
ncbi:MAG: RecQ family ATP-dependent DNA helicase ['Candidatus Kapabacteria' thiocyanatum]|uniref:ATP-dependent DNA helicase RecQ n=1 Tax=Candidatus Kapaibacterium thiocyanatum TaxID=1895771 RepID=A0A1M3KX72_9BACT|nr:RecQ family ATP-dependent DNA helicase ['Candidatus Kapabacteria' thiocyanatum]OJX57046.1 MAG: hypothetical protein BGO89_11085 ['Candidatus Kapabacteria' thiocyanatum]